MRQVFGMTAKLANVKVGCKCTIFFLAFRFFFVSVTSTKIYASMQFNHLSDICVTVFQCGLSLHVHRSDINECFELTDACNRESQHCLNGRGNYTCQNKAVGKCLPGFIYDTASKSCEGSNPFFCFQLFFACFSRGRYLQVSSPQSLFSLFVHSNLLALFMYTYIPKWLST